MELVPYTDPILITPCEPFDFENPPFDPIEFSKELVVTMRDKGGIGLAANQVGKPYQIFSIRTDPNKVMFNPRLVMLSTEKIVLDEACLSTPGLTLPIERSRHIRIRYQQPNGETLSESFTGITARIIQHEMMHLEGKMFFEGLISKLKLEMAIKKAAKLDVDYSTAGFLKYGT